MLSKKFPTYKIIPALCLLNFFFLTKDAFADIYNLKYLPLEKIEALNGLVITCILQDKKGFIWFGSNDGLT